MKRFPALKCYFFDKPARMCLMRLGSNFEDLMPKEETAVLDERERPRRKNCGEVKKKVGELR